MATQAVSPSGGRAAVRPVDRKVERIYFSGMAILLCAVVIIGFSPTYFAVGMLRAPLPSPILHIHGAVFTLWMLVYLVQSALVSARRVALHRTLGTFFFLLPPLMIVLGIIAAIDALKRGVKIGDLDPAVSLAIPLIGIATFTPVILAAWRNRRRSDSHKRLVVLATIGLADAALGRFPWASMGLSPAAGAVLGLAIVLAFPIAYDIYSLRKLHRSTVWAAPLIFVAGAFAVPIGMTPAWHAFAAFLNRVF